MPALPVYQVEFIPQERRLGLMSTLPVYQVEFIPLERRLGDRRIAPQGSALPRKVTADRREVLGRRSDDRLFAALKIV